MITLSSSAEADINAAADDIYTYVATPENWVGSHPQTAAVHGENTDQPAATGAAWVEDILFPDTDEPIGATWEVAQADPGRFWKIQTHVVDNGLPFTTVITYDLREHDGSTHFTRTMSADFDDDAAIPDHVRYQLTQTETHEGYLAALKERFEKA